MHGTISESEASNDGATQVYTTTKSTLKDGASVQYVIVLLAFCLFVWIIDIVLELRVPVHPYIARETLRSVLRDDVALRCN